MSDDKPEPMSEEMMERIRALPAPGGCGDSSCRFRRPAGLATNRARVNSRMMRFMSRSGRVGSSSGLRAKSSGVRPQKDRTLKGSIQVFCQTPAGLLKTQPEAEGEEQAL